MGLLAGKGGGCARAWKCQRARCRCCCWSTEARKRSMHFRLLKVFAILFIFSAPLPPPATAIASVGGSATALYLSAAVLVGEIVCNHENLISAQICWHCANVFYDQRKPNCKNSLLHLQPLLTLLFLLFLNIKEKARVTVKASVARVLSENLKKAKLH